MAEYTYVGMTPSSPLISKDLPPSSDRSEVFKGGLGLSGKPHLVEENVVTCLHLDNNKFDFLKLIFLLHWHVRHQSWEGWRKNSEYPLIWISWCPRTASALTGTSPHQPDVFWLTRTVITSVHTQFPQQIDKTTKLGDRYLGHTSPLVFVWSWILDQLIRILTNRCPTLVTKQRLSNEWFI